MLNVLGPYSDLVIALLTLTIDGTFRQSIANITDAIYAEIIASGQIRFGTTPDAASAQTIKGIIAKSVAVGEPVRVLIPWGSRKPSANHSIDIAEWMAVRQIEALQRRVREIYAPGLLMRLRLEDASGMWLFRNDADFTREVSDRYVGDMTCLMTHMDVNQLIAVPESGLMSEEAFATESDRLVPLFLRYITDSDEIGLENFQFLHSYQRLVAEGWQGEIASEQRDFYRNGYAKRFPSLDHAGRTVKLAEYLSNSLARHRLNATGIEADWKGHFIQLNFAAPAPGTPSGIGSNRIYYRTIPTRFCSTHIPPWRAFGFLKMSPTTATPKLAPGLTCKEIGTAVFGSFSFSFGIEGY